MELDFQIVVVRLVKDFGVAFQDLFFIWIGFCFSFGPDSVFSFGSDSVFLSDWIAIGISNALPKF